MGLSWRRLRLHNQVSNPVSFFWACSSDCLIALLCLPQQSPGLPLLFLSLKLYLCLPQYPNLQHLLYNLLPLRLSIYSVVFSNPLLSAEKNRINLTLSTTFQPSSFMFTLKLALTRSKRPSSPQTYF